MGRDWYDEGILENDWLAKEPFGFLRIPESVLERWHALRRKVNMEHELRRIARPVKDLVVILLGNAYALVGCTIWL